MEDWSGVRARGKRPRWRLAAEVVMVLALTVVFIRVVLPRFHGPEASAPAEEQRAGELAHLKMLGRALRLHADEHDGKFPTAISEIEWRQNLPAMKWAGLPAAVSRFHNPETGTVSDWLYYRDHTENDPPGTILVAAPVALGRAKDRRMVARINAVAEEMAEVDFQREIAEQAAHP